MVNGGGKMEETRASSIRSRVILILHTCQMFEADELIDKCGEIPNQVVSRFIPKLKWSHLVSRTKERPLRFRPLRWFTRKLVGVLCGALVHCYEPRAATNLGAAHLVGALPASGTSGQ